MLTDVNSSPNEWWNCHMGAFLDPQNYKAFYGEIAKTCETFRQTVHLRPYIRYLKYFKSVLWGYKVRLLLKILAMLWPMGPSYIVREQRLYLTLIFF